MASVPQTPWFSSLNPITPRVPPYPRNIGSTLKTFRVSSNAPESSSSATSTNSNSSDPQNKPGETVNKSDGSVPEATSSGKNREIPSAVKLAMERAKEYKKKKVVVDRSSKGVEDGGGETISGLKAGKRGNSGSDFVEKSVAKNKQGTISSIDFVGLNFSDKRQSRGLPPGLVPISDPYPEGDLPEVEIFVGDSSRFDDDDAGLKPKTTVEDNLDVYKPKVSTWGVFPRPNNISKTYGGGRVIQPGELLETAEGKAAKEARTRQLLAAYKTQTGMNIDPKLKSKCEKALADGDSLMDQGKLKEAISFYEEVMEKLPYKSELHGSAALQWSICQDSLNRSNEARVMYEKLQSHPNVQVNKKAKQFVFGFQAMEMLKVRSSSLNPRRSTSYQNYFDAFIKNSENYSLKDEPEDNEGALSQILPYIIFLVSPICLILLFAVTRGI